MWSSCVFLLLCKKLIFNVWLFFVDPLLKTIYSYVLFFTFLVINLFSFAHVVIFLPVCFLSLHFFNDFYSLCQWTEIFNIDIVKFIHLFFHGYYSFFFSFLFYCIGGDAQHMTEHHNVRRNLYLGPDFKERNSYFSPLRMLLFFVLEIIKKRIFPSILCLVTVSFFNHELVLNLIQCISASIKIMSSFLVFSMLFW